jgi:hypothetical protein
MKKTIIILLFTIVIISCSKEENKTPIIYGEENPLNGFLSQLFYYEETYTYINELGGIAQVGMSFTPLVKGKINAIVVKIPTINNNLKVAIWDKQTRAKLRVEYLNVTSANSFITKEITPLELSKDKEYVITMFSDDYYARNRTDNAVGEFPVISGNIKMTKSVTGEGETELYPLSGSGNQYFGDCSFNFQQTE